jgi:hypothetical protein
MDKKHLSSKHLPACQLFLTFYNIRQTENSGNNNILNAGEEDIFMGINNPAGGGVKGQKLKIIRINNNPQQQYKGIKLFIIS